MAVKCVACGIFQFELEAVLDCIRAEAGGDLDVQYLDPGLDARAETLEAAVREKLDGLSGDNIMLLFGSMCHTEWPRITEKSGARYPKPANCAEMLLSPEKKREIDATGNVYYLTMGGLKLWKSIYQEGHGWDDVDARQNFCYFDRIVVLDTGIFPVACEDLFEFFEYTQVAVEVEKISLEHFKSVVLDTLRRLQ